MKTTKIAKIANKAASMILDDHTHSEVCEIIRNQVMQDLGDEADPDAVEGKVCHILKVMYSNLSREMKEDVEEYG